MSGDDIPLRVSGKVPQAWFPRTRDPVAAAPAAATADLGGGLKTKGSLKGTRGVTHEFERRATKAAQKLNLNRDEKAMAIRLADDNNIHINVIHGVCARLILRELHV